MVASRNFRYGKIGKNSIVELPYAHGKFAMYVILPDIKGGNGLESLLSSLTQKSWSEALASMSNDALVQLRFPRFEIEDKYNLNEMLQALGIRRAFIPNKAQFDKLLSHSGINNFFIESVLQKARINVTEWGTEAAAVTAVMIGVTSIPGQPDKAIEFFADHPFVYAIVEKTSGVILFAGVFNSL
jgi:serpin B